MKKSLFAMGMLAMAVASCTNEEVVDIPSSKGISFNNPYVGTSVRAVHNGKVANETTLETLKGKEGDPDWIPGTGFYVYGGYKDVQVFNKTHVTYDGGWGYEPLSYWVDGENYKFLAYAPDMGVTPTYAWGSSTTDNDATLTFANITIDNTNQKDFVIGKSAVASPDAENTPGAQTITMRHALSMVKVSLTNGFRTGVNLAISDFAINGIKTTGTFKQFDNVVDKAGSWEVGETTSAFTHTTAFTLSTINDVYANEFIVIPQPVAAEVITVTFKGTLTDAGGKPIEVPEGTGTGKNEKVLTIKIPALTGGWAVNSRYNYTATIDGNSFGMKEITFGDPTIIPWGDYSNISLDN